MLMTEWQLNQLLFAYSTALVEDSQRKCQLVEECMEDANQGDPIEQRLHHHSYL